MADDAGVVRIPAIPEGNYAAVARCPERVVTKGPTAIR